MYLWSASHLQGGSTLDVVTRLGSTTNPVKDSQRFHNVVRDVKTNILLIINGTASYGIRILVNVLARTMTKDTTQKVFRIICTSSSNNVTFNFNVLLL